MNTGWWRFFLSGFFAAEALDAAVEGRWWVAVICLAAAVIQIPHQSWGLR